MPQCKNTSLILDNVLDLANDHLGYRAKGYLDTILSLADITRCISRKLCSTPARVEEMEYMDIKTIYEQLFHWANSIFPLICGDQSTERLNFQRKITPIGNLLPFQPAEKFLFVVQFY